MKTKTLLGGIVLASAFICQSAQEGMTRLWPATDAEMKALGDAKLTQAEKGPAVAANGTKSRWPGMKLCFKNGERDLSNFGSMSIAVSNTTDKSQRVHVSIKNRAYQGSSPGGCVDVPPHAVRPLDIWLSSSPWKLDAPLEFRGMRGYPVSSAGGKSFDLSHSYEIHIFVCDPTEPTGFAVSGVTVDAAAGSRPVKTLEAATFMPFVDEYGQFLHDEWPGKVHSDAELREDAKKERAELDRGGSSPIPGADRFGGWGEGPHLRPTGFFRVEKVNGKWWLVDPEGNLFFSNGIDCVNLYDCATGVQYRESYFKSLPSKGDPAFGRFWSMVSWPAAKMFYSETNHCPYSIYNFAMANMLRKYGADWNTVVPELAHRRMKSWGINTIGNWSSRDFTDLRRTPYVLTLGSHGAPRLEWADGWWGKLPDAAHPKFEQLVRQRAKDAARRMKDDPWCLGVFVDNELSWGNRDPRIPAVAEKYFSVVSKVLKDELPNHLYLGCRLAWATPEVYRLASRYCDVVSVNVYSRTFSCDLPEGSVDKPMINGEFHFGALDRGLLHTGLVPTADQDERAKCYREFVNSCLDHPRVVGTHWFQWKDQPLTGRSDGENYQIGFLTCTDKPYPEMVTAARDVAKGMYQRRYGASSR